jgi:hypothetical protein
MSEQGEATLDSIVWRTPEELVRMGFERSCVVMMNEAHNGHKRSIRTRRIGKRILSTAHEAGVRFLAMEALTPWFTEKANRTRHASPDSNAGYLDQPDMLSLIQAALDLGWVLIQYESDPCRWMKQKHDLDVSWNPDSAEAHKVLEPYLHEFTTMAYTNWREEEQARNLIAAHSSLERDSKMMVWCGNGHLYKEASGEWCPMGVHFKQLSDLDPFCIDQTLSVQFDPNHIPAAHKLLEQVAAEVARLGGTAGCLSSDVPALYPVPPGVDAIILSTDNGME